MYVVPVDFSMSLLDSEEEKNEIDVRKGVEYQQIFVRVSKYLTYMSTVQEYEELQLPFAASFVP